jgi:hypothetical protein
MERLLWKWLSGPHAPSANALRWAGVALCFFTACHGISAAQLTAQLDRDSITLGEAATLSLTFEGSQADQVPALPSIPNLQIAYTGKSSRVSSVNGAVSQTVTHNFQVTARQPGEYTIPALTANLAGQSLTTLPLKLRVSKPTSVSPDAMAAGTHPVFVKLVLPRKEIFLGEPLVAEVQFFFRQGTQVANSPQISNFGVEGFNLGRIIPGQRQQRVQIGNTVYSTASGYAVLTPIKTGPLTVGPVTATIVLAMPARTFEERFFGSPRQQVNVATGAETVQCRPLPTENVPPNFNGAVGNYQMTVTAGPTNVATGDPITVRARIAGTGLLDALSLPEQSAWRDFKMYPATVLPVETSDQLGLEGAKTFEQIVAPQTADIKELPEFSFSFFNPETKQYRTLAQPPIALTVRPGGTAPAPVVAVSARNANDTLPPPQDIVPIKQRVGRLQPAGQLLVQSPVFLATQSVPVLAFVAAFLWRRRADSLANNPRLRRQRAVAELVRHGLEDLRRLAAENKSEQFHAALFRLLQEQLGERLDCPASAITEAVVDEKLRPRGVPDTTLQQIHELFQSCNLARYAPVRSSQELAAMIPKLESALRRIQEVKA